MTDQCLGMLICGASGTGKTNALIHMLLKPLIYYDKIYLYAKNMEQDKYNLLTERLNKITNKHRVLLEDVLFSSNNEVNKTIINSIRIYITDVFDSIINLNGVDTSFWLYH